MATVESKVSVTRTRMMTGLGLAALVCYGIHGGYHLYHGRPEDLLWVCHIGAVFIGLGLLASSTVWSGVGTLFLCLGFPQWILYLALGGEFMPTSIFTHVIALCIGIYSVRLFGIPRAVWLKATVVIVILIVISRIVTPSEANVNVAFAIQEGWEKVFPSYPVYIVAMVGSAGVYFYLVEYAMRRWLVVRQEEVGS